MVSSSLARTIVGLLSILHKATFPLLLSLLLSGSGTQRSSRGFCSIFTWSFLLLRLDYLVLPVHSRGPAICQRVGMTHFDDSLLHLLLSIFPFFFSTGLIGAFMVGMSLAREKSSISIPLSFAFESFGVLIRFELSAVYIKITDKM